MILSNINNNHFTLLYHNNNINIDLKYGIIENNEIINNHKLEDKAETIYSNINEHNDIDKKKFYKELSSLENKNLKEILIILDMMIYIFTYIIKKLIMIKKVNIHKIS